MLYGSFSRGTAGPESDVDIAYMPADFGKEPLDAERRLGLVSELGELIGRDVDLSRDEPLLHAQVLRHGRLLLCNNPRAWKLFQAQVPSRYQDFKRERAAGEARLIKGFEST